jgi:hypothetical protein
MYWDLSNIKNQLALLCELSSYPTVLKVRRIHLQARKMALAHICTFLQSAHLKSFTAHSA